MQSEKSAPRHSVCHQIPGGKIEVKTYIRLKASRLPVIERHCPLVDVSAVVVFFIYRLKARRCV